MSDIADRFIKLNNATAGIADITVETLKYKKVDDIFLSLAEEIGELAEEIKIEDKIFGSDHKVSKEGIIGELADVLISNLSCCIAMPIETISTEIFILQNKKFNNSSEIIIDMMYYAGKKDTLSITHLVDLIIKKYNLDFDKFCDTVKAKIAKWKANHDKAVAKREAFRYN